MCNISTLATGFLLLIFSNLNFAQNTDKKQMDHEDLLIWKTIRNTEISQDGKWVSYVLKAEEGDPELVLWNADKSTEKRFPRADKAKFNYEGTALIYTLHPAVDSVTALKRKKTKKEDLPKDSIVIYTLKEGKADTIANVKSYQISDHWGEWIACHLEPGKTDKQNTEEPDSTKTETTKKRKESKDNGSRLLLRSYATAWDTIFNYVTEYTTAEKAPTFLIYSTGTDTLDIPGVWVFDGSDRSSTQIDTGKGKHHVFSLSENGKAAAWIVNRDTLKSYRPPNELRYWNKDTGTSQSIMSPDDERLPNQWIVSADRKPLFLKNSDNFIIGMAPAPLVRDTLLLDDEIVQVEVWHHNDPMLYTQQSVRADSERKRSYDILIDPKSGSVTPVSEEHLPETIFHREMDIQYVILYNDKPYLKEASWGGFPNPRDVYIRNLSTGKVHSAAIGLRGNVSFSAQGKYVLWYSYTDSLWMAYSVDGSHIVWLNENMDIAFYDEENDIPNEPSPYGLMGWSEDDRYVFIYDKYDIWRFDLSNQSPPKALTNGRATEKTYRYIKTNPEERNIPLDKGWLLHCFDNSDKSSGYSSFDPIKNELKEQIKDNMFFGRNVRKARNAESYVFTKESFEIFPDLHYTDASFKNIKRVSHANPQQKAYSWGTAELIEWVSLDGKKLQGLLYKPENYDAQKSYPMIVNFYEKSSNRLHNYWTPSPGRSTINYSFYVNRGYVIFNPDIPYREGYPGESAYNAVIPGVTALINQGVADKDRIGIQGHSWGGYQIAYLLTRTNIFKAAESGAPVVNMLSAYGGIRWETGLSRMFQYEKTQSRIGGHIWEYPLRYIENSPIFTMDKVETPVLIMHNDKDGHVPWYQGIEYFIALRRLNKPAWLLNYNEEPHWPLKLQNRKDFNIRMQQFFDHYLMDAPMPRWMHEGVPAVKKTFQSGYELFDSYD
jgi:acetyl esterase/lipase